MPGQQAGSATIKSTKRNHSPILSDEKDRLKAQCIGGIGRSPGMDRQVAADTDSQPDQLQQLEDQLRHKDEHISVLQKKLDHFRAWLQSLQTQVQAKDPQILKNARRLYIGGIPEGTKEDELRTFFEGIMATTGASIGPESPIATCKISSDKSYAFLEMRSVEEASNAMAFDGIVFHDTNLKIRRPSNYNAVDAAPLGPTSPDPTLDTSHIPMCKTVVEDSWNKIFVGGLPCNYGDEQVKELLQPYGSLKSFNLVMDKNTGKSKGYAFCEFTDPRVIPAVINGLHMQCLERKVLTVKRALEGNRQGGGGKYLAPPLGATAAAAPGSSNTLRHQHSGNTAATGGGSVSSSSSSSALQRQDSQQQQQQQQGPVPHSGSGLGLSGPPGQQGFAPVGPRNPNAGPPVGRGFPGGLRAPQHMQHGGNGSSGMVGEQQQQQQQGPPGPGGFGGFYMPSAPVYHSDGAAGPGLHSGVVPGQQQHGQYGGSTGGTGRGGFGRDNGNGSTGGAGPGQYNSSHRQQQGARSGSWQQQAEQQQQQPEFPGASGGMYGVGVGGHSPMGPAAAAAATAQQYQPAMMHGRHGMLPNPVQHMPPNPNSRVLQNPPAVGHKGAYHAGFNGSAPRVEVGMGGMQYMSPKQYSTAMGVPPMANTPSTPSPHPPTPPGAHLLALNQQAIQAGGTGSSKGDNSSTAVARSASLASSGGSGAFGGLVIGTVQGGTGGTAAGGTGGTASSPVAAITGRMNILSPGIGGGAATAAAALGLGSRSARPSSTSGDIVLPNSHPDQAASISSSSSSLYHHDSLSQADGVAAAAIAAKAAAAASAAAAATATAAAAATNGGADSGDGSSLSAATVEPMAAGHSM